MTALLYILAVYLILSAIFWPFNVGKTRTYTAGYAIGNMAFSGLLAILFLTLAPIVAAAS